jgi:hypothetical protein
VEQVYKQYDSELINSLTLFSPSIPPYASPEKKKSAASRSGGSSSGKRPKTQSRLANVSKAEIESMRQEFQRNLKIAEEALMPTSSEYLTLMMKLEEQDYNFELPCLVEIRDDLNRVMQDGNVTDF